MRRSAGIMLLFLLIATPATARIKLAALPEREVVVVRLDNPSATLVEEERLLTLQEGENQVDFSWRGVQIDPDSIRLAILSHPEKVTLLSVAYPPNEEALVWRLHAGGAWEERVRISYLLSALDRLVSYRGRVSKDERTLDLEGSLVLRNFSGEDFAAAQVVLGDGAPAARPLANEETRRFLLFTARGIPVKKAFTWDAAQLPWEPKLQSVAVGIPVHYVLRNDKASGLGVSLLWAGKARIFQDDSAGGEIFLGEDTVANVPTGEEMRILIGESRDVAVTQRKVTDRRHNQRPAPQRVKLYDTEEAMNVTVENFKDQAVTVDVVEHIPGEWEMAEADQPYEKKDVNTIVFHIEMPAAGKAGQTTRNFAFRYQRRNVRP